MRNFRQSLLESEVPPAGAEIEIILDLYPGENDAAFSVRGGSRVKRIFDEKGKPVEIIIFGEKGKLKSKILF